MRNVFYLDFAGLMKDLYWESEFLTNVIHLKIILIHLTNDIISIVQVLCAYILKFIFHFGSAFFLLVFIFFFDKVDTVK